MERRAIREKKLVCVCVFVLFDRTLNSVDEHSRRGLGPPNVISLTLRTEDVKKQNKTEE